jgi:Fe-S-cluster containining protein
MRVTVSEEMRHLLSDRDVFEKYPESCPFLRYISEAEARCIIHSTRPDYCEKSGCYDYLISDQEGIICGKIKNRFVIGANEGVSEVLLSYSDIISLAPYDVFIKKITDALKKAGYIIS